MCRTGYAQINRIGTFAFDMGSCCTANAKLVELVPWKHEANLQVLMQLSWRPSALWHPSGMARQMACLPQQQQLQTTLMAAALHEHCECLFGMLVSRDYARKMQQDTPCSTPFLQV